MRFYLIIDYTRGQARELKAFIRSQGLARYKIIVKDDFEVKQELQTEGLVVKEISDYVGIDRQKELGIYDYAHQFSENLTKEFADVQHRGVEITQGLYHHLMDNLIFLKKIETIFSILEREQLDGFILLIPHSYYNYEYLCLVDYAAERGYCEKRSGLFSCRKGEVAEFNGKIVETDLASFLPPRPSDTEIQYEQFAQRQIRRRLKIHDWLNRWLMLKTEEFDQLQHQYSYEAFVVVQLPQMRRKRKTRFLFFLQNNEYDLYWKPVYPIMVEFQTLGVAFLVLTDDSRVCESCKRLNVGFIDLRYWCDVLRASTIGSHARAQVLSLFFERFKQLIPRWHGVPRPVEYHLLSYLWHVGFYDLMVRNILMIDLFSDILSTTRPKSVFVMPDSSPSSHLMCAVARFHKIPTITTLAASVGSSFRSIGVYKADFIAVYGQEAAQAFRQAGYNSKRLIPTGNPALDHVSQRSLEADRRYVQSKIDLDVSKRVFLIATSRFDPNEFQWISRFIEVLNRRADCEVIIKIHPLYGRTHYDDLMKRCQGLRYHLVREMELYPLLNIADVVVTDYSHVGVEAAMFGKPLLVVNLTGKPYPSNRFDEVGIALGVHSMDEIEPGIERILADEELLTRMREKRNDVVDRYNYRNDGKAAHRIFQLLTNPPRRRTMTKRNLHVALTLRSIKALIQGRGHWAT